MVVSYKVLTIYLLIVVSSAQSQFYGQNGYQPYYQYPGYNPGYVPYPYVQPQSYQPYVSTQSSYFPYYSGYPAQYPTYGAQPYSAYGTQQYNPSAQPFQTFYPAVYPGSEYTQNPYTSYAPTSVGYVPTAQTSPNTGTSQNKTQNDPYANIRTDIIDVEPQYFHYYKRFFNLEDNLHPIEVIPDDRTSGARQRSGTSYRPTYIVKTESKTSNITNIPSIKKHDVQTKTYSFKKSFSINPNKKNNEVINVNILNGVEVTTSKPGARNSSKVTTASPLEADQSLTTESEKPVKVNGWFGFKNL